MSSNQSGPILQTAPAYSSSGGNGVSPPFFFSRSGNNPVGTFLKVGDVISSETGQLIVGTNIATKIVISNYNLTSSVTRLQFQERTSRTTWSDLTGLYIDMPIGEYRWEVTPIGLVLPTNVEVNCYIHSGSNLNDTVAGLYVVPA